MCKFYYYLFESSLTLMSFRYTKITSRQNTMLFKDVQSFKSILKLKFKFKDAWTL